jgi:sodium/potassium-transporting ATPase subunit alpha
VILVIGYTPIGHALFGTAPITWTAWVLVLPFAMAMLILEEARKAFVRSRP